MKLFSIQILLRDGAPNGDPVALATAYDASSFGYFQRSGVRERINGFCRTFVHRTPTGQRQSVRDEAYDCHVYVHPNGLAGFVVTDAEYPRRVAFALLNKLLDDYDKETHGSWRRFAAATAEVPELDWLPLTTALTDYQDPSTPDKIAAIQKELDEIPAVLPRTIDNKRLDDLVYPQAEQTTSYCRVM